MFSCSSRMQIMKHYEVVCGLHRRRSCTLWCLFLMAWTSPPYLSWTLPLWEEATPWCPGITCNLTTIQTQRTVLSTCIHLTFKWIKMRNGCKNAVVAINGWCDIWLVLHLGAKTVHSDVMIAESQARRVMEWLWYDDFFPPIGEICWSSAELPVILYGPESFPDIDAGSRTTLPSSHKWILLLAAWMVCMNWTEFQCASNNHSQHLGRRKLITKSNRSEGIK